MQTRTFFSVGDNEEKYAILVGYALRWARNPDAGSEFDRKTEELRKLPDSKLLESLRRMNYDMFLGYEDKVIGHLAFQRQNDGLHIFSVSTSGEYRSNPYVIMDIVRYFLEYLRKNDERKFRLSAGNNRSMKNLLRILSRCEGELGVKVLEDYWVEVKA